MHILYFWQTSTYFCTIFLQFFTIAFYFPLKLYLNAIKYKLNKNVLTNFYKILNRQGLFMTFKII